MPVMTNAYFKDYRQKLGFTNQDKLKKFFKGNDIIPEIDYNYIDLLNARIKQILKKLNDVVVNKNPDIDYFCEKHIDKVYIKLKGANKLPRLNNQGRRPEEVYFAWMMGSVITNYFKSSIGQVFGVKEADVKIIGDDDIENTDNFKRTAKADMEINLPNKEKIRIEIQSGFQGINDIKKHKISEAKRIKRESNVSTVIIHFDLFNGQVAFIKADDIDENRINWRKREQFEGQMVFNIEENDFLFNENCLLWKLTEAPPKYEK